MSQDLQHLIDPFLYGELSEQELETFEESFFLDDDLFEQIETAEMRLIDRYVRNEMNRDERKRFETGYLTTPERQKKVAEARIFHRELAKIKLESKGFLAGLFEMFSFKVSVLQFASVATIILICVGALWTLWILQTDPQPVAEGNVDVPDIPVNSDTNLIPTPQQPNVVGNNEEQRPAPTPAAVVPPKRQKLAKPVFATLAAIPGMRGTNVYRVVRISDDTTQLNLSIQLPESATEGDYRVSVRNEAGQEIWSRLSVPSRPGDKGPVLNMIVSRGDLKLGRFRVTAEIESAGIPYGFGLEILKESAKEN
ncbi:MAG TPA: hypothetical protein VMM38_00785 [Aridibacter sp.]|nr:hypothetical protein [Aridibacter sp.]